MHTLQLQQARAENERLGQIAETYEERWLKDQARVKMLEEAVATVVSVIYYEVAQSADEEWFWMECRFCGNGGPKGKPEEYYHEDGCITPLLEAALTETGDADERGCWSGDS